MLHMCSVGFKSRLPAGHGSGMVVSQSTLNANNPAKHEHDVFWHCHPLALALIEEGDCQHEAERLQQDFYIKVAP